MIDQTYGGDDVVVSVAKVVRLLGDPTRLRLLGLLQPGEMNVTALCRQLRLAQPTVSHHLGLLRLADLVQTRRVGKQIFYSLNPERISGNGEGGLNLTTEHVKMCIGSGVSRPQRPPLSPPQPQRAVLQAMG